jgi:RecA/RadA recombinase
MAAPSKKKAPEVTNPFLALSTKLTCMKEGRVVSDDFKELIFPTASIVLDDVLRLKGIPFNGRMIHIHGNPHGGKSTIGYGCIREFQKSGIGGGYAAIWDWEKTCTPEYLRQLGVDSSKVWIFQPSNLRMALHDAYLVAKDGVRMHMVDSIAMMQNSAGEKEILNGEALNNRVGYHAKIVSEFFTEYMAIAADFDLSTICINQTRARIDTSREGQMAAKYPNMVQLPYELPGGRKPRFLSSIMLEVNIEKEYYGARPSKDSDFLMEAEPKVKVAPIVNRVGVRVLKNKVNAGGFRKGHLWIRPGKGVDDFISIRELAVSYGLIEYAAGKGYRVGSVEDPIITYGTKEEAITALVTTPDLDVLSKLRKQVSAAVLSDDSSRATLSEAEAAEIVGEQFGALMDGDEDDEIEMPVKKGKAKSKVHVIDADDIV